MSDSQERPYTNSDLFNDRYLEKRLPERPEWDCDDEAQSALDDLKELYDEKYETVQTYIGEESDTISDWIKPIVEILGYDSLGECSFPHESGKIDRVLFDSDESQQAASQARQNDDYEALYQSAETILEAKSWDWDYSQKFSDDRKYFDSSQQIDFYLSYMPQNTVRWGILTNGRSWRIYGVDEPHSYVYYQIDDLPELIKEGDLEEFKYFFTLFRPSAFKRRGGDCFLDTVYRESEQTALDIGDDLQDNVFNALATLAEGFIETNDLVINDSGVIDSDSLSHDASGEKFTLEELRQESLVYLYRLMFLFYAESKGLLEPNTDQGSKTYHAELSLIELRDDIVSYGESPEEVANTYLIDSTTQWSRLNTFFEFIDSGQTDIGIQAYNGGLFDVNEHEFLASHEVSNQYLSKVIYLISTTETDNGYEPVDYGELQIRHLGSIYEGLLQHNLKIATTDRLAVIEDDSDDEEWIDAADKNSDHTVIDRVSEGELYLTTDSNERKISGSFYTPKYIVDYIIEWNVQPKVDEIHDALAETDITEGTEEYAREFRQRVLDLNILDPAMGSGHFLTRVTSHLAKQVIEVVREADEIAGKAIENAEFGADDTVADGGPSNTDDPVTVSKFEERQIRRDIAKECIFGVDKNAVAVELAKLSMWLETLAEDQPLAFLDHHLKQGDSLLGSDIESIEGINDTGLEEEQATLTPNDRLEEVIQTLVDVFEDLVDIPNETLEDARAMKRIYYEDIQSDPQYIRFKQLANVDMADKLGLDWTQASAFDRGGIQSDAFQYMAHYLQSNEHWYGEGVEEGVIEKSWFQSAQQQAEDLSFFHWKLEFPEVFYNVAADEQEDPGFDAIVGNPPWLGTRTGDIPDSVSDYLKSAYDMSGQSDLVEGFLNRCLQIGGSDCSVGFVVPKNIASNEAYESLRETLYQEETLNHAVDFDVAFEDVNTDAMVLGINSELGTEQVVVGERVSETDVTLRSIDTELIDEMPYNIFPVNSTQADIELVSQINAAKTSEVDQHVEIDRGYEFGMNHDCIGTDETANSLPLVDHRDVERHAIDYSGYYVDLDAVPASKAKETSLFTSTPKILIRYLESTITAARDQTGYASTNLIHHVTPEVSLEYLLGLLNSNLTSFWYKHAFQSVEVKFPKVQKSHINNLPAVFPDENQDDTLQELYGDQDLPDDHIHDSVRSKLEAGDVTLTDVYDELEAKIETLITKKEERFNVDIGIDDYIPLSERDTPLADVGVLVSDADSDSPLYNTKTDYREEKLELRRVEFVKDGSSVAVKASVRYKPDDPEEHETENGYVETELLDAFTLVNLSEEQAALIEAFAPKVIENSSELRGFYMNATTNITPYKRLTQYLEVPLIDDWEDEWEQYVRANDYASDLAREVAEAEETVNSYVYLLFGLSDKEIEIVEESE